VLAEEAHVGRVIDPAGGAGYLETLTDEIARAAWSRFQAIEAAGGVVRALESGHIAEFVAQSRAEIAARIERREAKVLGVTDFPIHDGVAPELSTVEATAAEAPSPRLPGPDSRCPPLVPVRLEDLA
jgi:methylmalonyl-CoA mutase